MVISRPSVSGPSTSSKACIATRSTPRREASSKASSTTAGTLSGGSIDTDQHRPDQRYRIRGGDPVDNRDRALRVTCHRAGGRTERASVQAAQSVTADDRERAGARGQRRDRLNRSRAWLDDRRLRQGTALRGVLWSSHEGHCASPSDRPLWQDSNHATAPRRSADPAIASLGLSEEPRVNLQTA